jgi:streptogramin lyase
MIDLLPTLGALILAAAPTQGVRLPSVPPILARGPSPTPIRLVVARDHGVWISMNRSGSLIHVDPSGRPSVVGASRHGVPFDLAPLRDGRVLFNQYGATMTGAIAQPMPSLGCARLDGPCTGVMFPRPFLGIDDLALNRTGDIAIIDTHGAVYGRRTATGVQVYHPPSGYGPTALTVTDDGAFWFALGSRSNHVPTGPDVLVRIDKNGHVTRRTITAGRSISVLLADGNDVMYAAGTAANDTVFEFVPRDATLGRTTQPARRVEGGVGSVLLARSRIWFVPSDALGTLREIDARGVVRTIALPELHGETIVALGADDQTLWCVTLENGLYSFHLRTLSSGARAKI